MAFIHSSVRFLFGDYGSGGHFFLDWNTWSQFILFVQLIPDQDTSIISISNYIYIVNNKTKDKIN